MRPPSPLRTAWGAARAVSRRPRLWPVAVRQLRRLAPRRWWLRPPFLPWPDAGLAAFRSETMYGDGAAVPAPSDVVTWLEWCRAQPTTRAPRQPRAAALRAER